MKPYPRQSVSQNLALGVLHKYICIYLYTLRLSAFSAINFLRVLVPLWLFSLCSLCPLWRKNLRNPRLIYFFNSVILSENSVPSVNSVAKFFRFLLNKQAKFGIIPIIGGGPGNGAAETRTS